MNGNKQDCRLVNCWLVAVIHLWCVTVQWGWPTFSTPGILGMLLAMMASIVVSVDDYYACARLTGVEMPPEHAVNRGVCVQLFWNVITRDSEICLSFRFC